MTLKIPRRAQQQLSTGETLTTTIDYEANIDALTKQDYTALTSDYKTGMFEKMADASGKVINPMLVRDNDLKKLERKQKGEEIVAEYKQEIFKRTSNQYNNWLEGKYPKNEDLENLLYRNDQASDLLKNGYYNRYGANIIDPILGDLTDIDTNAYKEFNQLRRNHILQKASSSFAVNRDAAKKGLWLSPDDIQGGYSGAQHQRTIEAKSRELEFLTFNATNKIFSSKDAMTIRAQDKQEIDEAFWGNETLIRAGTTTHSVTGANLFNYKGAIRLLKDKGYTKITDEEGNPMPKEIADLLIKRFGISDKDQETGTAIAVDAIYKKEEIGNAKVWDDAMNSVISGNISEKMKEYLLQGEKDGVPFTAQSINATLDTFLRDSLSRLTGIKTGERAKKQLYLREIYHYVNSDAAKKDPEIFDAEIFVGIEEAYRNGEIKDVNSKISLPLQEPTTLLGFLKKRHINMDQFLRITKNISGQMDYKLTDKDWKKVEAVHDARYDRVEYASWYSFNDSVMAGTSKTSPQANMMEILGLTNRNQRRRVLINGIIPMVRAHKKANNGTMPTDNEINEIFLTYINENKKTQAEQAAEDSKTASGKRPGEQKVLTEKETKDLENRVREKIFRKGR